MFSCNLKNFVNFTFSTMKRKRKSSLPAGIINISLPAYMSRIRSDRRYPNSRGVSCSALLAGTERIGNRAAVSCEKNRISLVSLLLPLPMYIRARVLGCDHCTDHGTIHIDRSACIPETRRLEDALPRIVTEDVSPPITWWKSTGRP